MKMLGLIKMVAAACVLSVAQLPAEESLGFDVFDTIGPGAGEQIVADEPSAPASEDGTSKGKKETAEKDGHDKKKPHGDKRLRGSEVDGERMKAYLKKRHDQLKENNPELFKSLDTNGDGRLSKEEMIAGREKLKAAKRDGSWKHKR